jgi:hypothetical protein
MHKGSIKLHFMNIAFGADQIKIFHILLGHDQNIYEVVRSYQETFRYRFTSIQVFYNPVGVINFTGCNGLDTFGV